MCADNSRDGGRGRVKGRALEGVGAGTWEVEGDNGRGRMRGGRRGRDHNSIVILGHICNE